MAPAETEAYADIQPLITLQRSEGWRLAVAQKRGTSHETSGEACQDAYGAAMPSPEALVITIADGAGSAKYAEVGASMAASRAVAAVCTRLADAESAPDETGLKDILYEGLVAARGVVEAEAATRRVSVHDLSTTLILVIARPDCIAVAQIGDGAIVIADDAGKLIGLTRPPVGEYINETTFLTSADALRTAQMTIWRGRAKRLAAFSDGLQLLCLKWPECLPHEGFFSPLFNFIRNATDEPKATQDLVSFLESERIKELTDDDITLVLSCLLSCPDEC